MKIDSIARTDHIKSIQTGSSKVKGTNKLTKSNDEVAFSAEARIFSKAFNAAKAAHADTDAARLADVKARIEAGTYFVPSDKIADSIIGKII